MEEGKVMQDTPQADTKFVVLQGIQERNRFFTSYIPGHDYAKLDDGTVAYYILGYTKTAGEAQTALFGRSYVCLVCDASTCKCKKP
jgi:hypothetical protein